MKSLRASLLLAVAAVLAETACSDDADAVPLGRWGGRNAELVVTSTGANARFKCGATGVIGGGSRRRIGLRRPGELLDPRDQPRRAVRALCRLRVRLGHDLALSISGQPAGTFQLHLGADPAFDVCNF